MNVFVARQPIFDCQQNVYGYELLYRAGSEEAFSGQDGDLASLSVIMNSMLLFGFDRIGNGKRLFINFTRNLLLNNTALYLPKEAAVIEILEDVAPDKDMMAALMQLKKNGYTLALDDFALNGNAQNPLLNLVDILKVDLMSNTVEERRLIAERFSRQGAVRLLAEKTETREEFKESLQLGYSLFQGYFFSKPVIISRRAIPPQKLIYVQMLRELSKEDLDFNALQKVIMRDPCVTYMLFKYINSTFFGVKYEVTSIRHALRLLGEQEIKKWCSMTVLIHMSGGQPDELVQSALLRARFCETLGRRLSMKSLESELFLMGLFSYMDVLLGRPLSEVLEEISLSSELKDVLLGKTNSLSSIYELVLSYERGDWDDVTDRISRLNIGAEEITTLYTQSFQWVSQALTV